MNIKYKIVFLIPVFEAADCVEDYIQNIHTICPNSAIVFHVNSLSSDEYYKSIERLCEYYSFCYLLVFPDPFILFTVKPPYKVHPVCSKFLAFVPYDVGVPYMVYPVVKRVGSLAA